MTALNSLLKSQIQLSFRKLSKINIHKKMISNIDCSDSSGWNEGLGFQPLGDSILSFKANFNGNNHTISNLFLRSKDNSILLSAIFLQLAANVIAPSKLIRVKNCFLRSNATLIPTFSFNLNLEDPKTIEQITEYLFFTASKNGIT